jgi:hypothetical protein
VNKNAECQSEEIQPSAGKRRLPQQKKKIYQFFASHKKKKKFFYGDIFKLQG